MSAVERDKTSRSGLPLRLLYIEDNVRDSMACNRYLEQLGFELTADIVSSPEHFAQALVSKPYDLILADYQMPGWSGLDALDTLQKEGRNIPFILVTGTMGEETAVECIKKGATDYVLKDRLQRLPFAVVRALEEAKAREQRNQVEAMLHLRTEALEAAAHGVLITDQKGQIIWVNQAFAGLTGYSAAEVLGNNPRLLKSGEQDAGFYQSLWTTILAGKVWHGEIVNRRKDGSLYTEESTITPVIGRNGKITHFIDIKQDVSERKKAEQKILASLREKEILLKEIHHRVKNNMQVISSMLRMASQGVHNPQAREVMTVSQRRVRSMALVHEKLYGSGDLARIDFRDYISSLVKDLFRSSGFNREAIRYSVDVSDLRMDVDTAVPCGLILNELVSNCLKHAFPSERQGQVSIEMRSDAESKITLVVRDDGVGLPHNMDYMHPDSVGLQLVNALTQQLSGSIRFHSNHGTEISIEFRT